MDDAVGDTRYAPPAALVADVNPDLPLSGHLASRWRRLGAVMIDALLSIAVLWLVGRYPPLNVWANANPDIWALHFNWLSVAIGLVVFLVLQSYLLATRGQTIGKALLKIRIVRTDGQRASALRIIGLRYSWGLVFNLWPPASMVYSLIDTLMIFRRSRRCLHDAIADTTVVNV